MDVLDPSSEACHFDQVARDIPGHIGQVWNSGDGADFRVSPAQRRREDEHDKQQEKSNALHSLTPLSIVEAMHVAPKRDRPLHKELVFMVTWFFETSVL